MKVELIGRGEEAAEWDEYVLNHRASSGYHLAAWRRVIEHVFGHETLYLLARDGSGDVRGVLPLVVFSNWLFGRFVVSMPFVNYGGCLYDSGDAQGALVGKAVELAGQLGATHIELRQEAILNVNWPCKQHKISMRLDLPPKFEVLWETFPSKLKSQVRRAEKEGMVVRLGGLERLDDFYTVYCRNMRDLGTPVYGRRLFEEVLRSFRKDAKVCAVYCDQRPVAAGILYGFRNTLEIPWAASDRRYHRMAPNMLLYKSALQHACNEGFSLFDFGRTTCGSGPHSFKAQWKARPVALYWYYWVRDGGMLPNLTPQNRRFRWAIALWKKLPVMVTQAIGPRIVKNIP